MPRINISPRKVPRQQRSLATVEVILQAATRVLSRESLAGFNTNRVAEVAGVSVGSVYQYFPNKAALVTALIDRAQTELSEAFEMLVRQLQSKPGNTLAESLHAVAQLTIAQQYANPVFAAALDHEEARLPVQKQLRAAQQRLPPALLNYLPTIRQSWQPTCPSLARGTALPSPKHWSRWRRVCLKTRPLT